MTPPSPVCPRRLCGTFAGHLFYHPMHLLVRRRAYPLRFEPIEFAFQHGLILPPKNPFRLRQKRVVFLRDVMAHEFAIAPGRMCPALTRPIEVKLVVISRVGQRPEQGPPLLVRPQQVPDGTILPRQPLACKRRKQNVVLFSVTTFAHEDAEEFHNLFQSHMGNPFFPIEPVGQASATVSVLSISSCSEGLCNRRHNKLSPFLPYPACYEDRRSDMTKVVVCNWPLRKHEYNGYSRPAVLGAQPRINAPAVPLNLRPSHHEGATSSLTASSDHQSSSRNL
jgi:hypothetical protein